MDYDRRGNLVQQASYRMNLMEGPLTRYWPNGKKMEVTHYKAGKPIGPPQLFDDKGAEKSSTENRGKFSQRIEKLVKG